MPSQLPRLATGPSRFSTTRHQLVSVARGREDPIVENTDQPEGAAMRKTIATLGVILLSLTQPATPQDEASHYSQKTLLKNWALSRCLWQVYADGKAKEDANATASAYLEIGHQPIEAYDALSALVTQYANRKYASSVGSDLNTMKCIDLFHSKELDTLMSRLVKTK
jgi:hypothetical protein